jgi:ATP-dependent protease ClpP protease subunit
MPVKIAAFRENPSRAIFITGEIGQAMVDRLTPQIIRLQHDGNAPITVYIDSVGGITYHARLLQQLLNNPDQDGIRCPIITVVTGMAASSAADILASGHYAIAYRHSLIHFHGVRTNRGDITHESASSLAESLKQSNEGYALELAQRILSRFVFVYLQLEQDFNNVRLAKPGASDVECLAECMTHKLGGSSTLLELAVMKHQRLHELLEYYEAQLAAHRDAFARPAEKEAFLLKCLIDWELTGNPDQEWRFRSEGLNAIREDFVLLVDYEDGQHMANVEQQSKEWGGFLLDHQQRIEHDALPEDQRSAYVLLHTKDRFRPVWHFLVSVCRALQQGENRLSPYEAYWLGLIDEIPGSSLPSVREVIEKRNEISAAAPLPAPKRLPRAVAAKRKTKRSAPKTPAASASAASVQNSE